MSRRLELKTIKKQKTQEGEPSKMVVSDSKSTDPLGPLKENPGSTASPGKIKIAQNRPKDLKRLPCFEPSRPVALPPVLLSPLN